VTVNVAANATSPQVNQVSVSGGGSAAANASDSTVVNPGSGSGDVQLIADGGAFDSSLGYPEAQPHVYFVDRLTPPSYPATLKSVQIYFENNSLSLPVNSPITVVAAANPGGGSIIDGELHEDCGDHQSAWNLQQLSGDSHHYQLRRFRGRVHRR